MASNLPKRDSGSLSFEAETPHFFKIILDDTINNGKFGIPKRFVRKYGNDLSSPILLKVPSGAKWKVEIIECDGEIWLKNGWKEFMEYYSLAHGSFLVFEYDKKNSHFNVIIFDKSASEIDYPYLISNGDDDEEPNDNLDKEFQEQMIEKEIENEASFEFLDDFSLSRKTKQKSPLSLSQPHKKMKFVESFTTKVEENRRYEGISCQKQIASRIKPLRAKEKKRALHVAITNFKSKNPFFMKVMQPSYIYPGDKMNIPASYVRKYLSKKQGGDATLIGLDGKTWSIKYCIHNVQSNDNPSARITNGWRVFAQENYLQVGDVCVFELIKSNEITYKVTIFRQIEGNIKQSVDEKISSSKELIKKPSFSNLPGAIEAAKEFTSVHPFFKVVIVSRHLKQANVYVPHDFIIHIKQRTEKAKLQVGDKWWPVSLHSYLNCGKGLICGGWPLFVRENSLRVGDVCVFKLLDCETLLIKVSIFRKV